MRSAYTEVGPGIFRPLIPLWVWGPDDCYLTDGILDSGADRTILNIPTASKIGIRLEQLTATVNLRTATNQALPCKLANVVLEIRRKPARVCWSAEIGVAVGNLPQNLWGFKGFLEFFRATFDGPRRTFTLVPGRSLPRVKRPRG